MQLVSFNPHPPVGAGATMYLLGLERAAMSFQSSPARGGGCNETDASVLVNPEMFQSSPARGGGCNRGGSPRTDASGESFNPHPPVGAGATFTVRLRRVAIAVSILTRPWGRVQRGLENARERFPKRKCSSCQGVPCRALGG